jgi:hypothetical protein
MDTAMVQIAVFVKMDTMETDANTLTAMEFSIMTHKFVEAMEYVLLPTIVHVPSMNGQVHNVPFLFAMPLMPTTLLFAVHMDLAFMPIHVLATALMSALAVKSRFAIIYLPMTLVFALLEVLASALTCVFATLLGLDLTVRFQNAMVSLLIIVLFALVVAFVLCLINVTVQPDTWDNFAKPLYQLKPFASLKQLAIPKFVLVEEIVPQPTIVSALKVTRVIDASTLFAMV